MVGHQRGGVVDRLELVRLIRMERLTKREAANRLGVSFAWARKWWQRYRQSGEAALAPPAPTAPGPLARFSTQVAAAVLEHRRRYPRLGARRARLTLERDPALQGQCLPDARTIHRAWVHAGLLPRRLPPDTPPPPPRPARATGDLHAVWEVATASPPSSCCRAFGRHRPA